ncbi:mannose-6-phosphate isomerase, class I [Jiangella alba]|uniref:mannose-6-phosphate isomerase n=1 Tax=Jiangella alba TaxID=561176 RepID=A0A1H5H9S0_9ACTN|nr:mannose-6-phosphate isomerase, class I [Jiangella alba]SEE24722.1 mannose-6-phosphate isomerase, type 1 [Jiangella alba]
MAVLLDNPVRSYAWGSPTVIPELLGRAPSGQPEAELWVGAHPGSPSTVVGDGRPLSALIEADPAATLGAAVVGRFGPRLPFLLKVLAVERPLSIQVHPTIEQAAEGYDAEDAAGLALDDPRRSYHDRNHKPEMAVAVTPFDALVGFDDPAAVAASLEQCEHTDLVGAAAVLRESDGLERLVRRWLTLDDAAAAQIVTALTAEASARRDDPRFALVHRLAEVYPHDRGLLLALLLRHHTLAPGEAVFVPAGVPHAYLSGVAVEPQASSDNTLRAGLTPKHVDAPEVLRILRYEPHGAVAVRPVPAGPGLERYPVDGIDELGLSRVRLTAGTAVPVPGPLLVLVVEGAAAVDGVTLARGRAAFVPAAESGATLTGDGVAFTLTTALDQAR